MNTITKLLSNRACHGGPGLPPGWIPVPTPPIYVYPCPGIPLPAGVQDTDQSGADSTVSSATVGTTSGDHDSHLASE